MKNTILLLVCLVGFWVLLPFPGLRLEAQDKQVQSFVGSGVCLECHQKRSQTTARSPHFKRALKDAPVNADGCESCHGPGGAHVNAGGGKGVGGIRSFGKNTPAAEKSSVCLKCHQLSKQNSFWDVSAHKKNDVACDNCHSIHALDTMANLKNQVNTCGTCHKDIKARTNRRSHHPIVEGKLQCSNCHNPHGALGPSMIKASSVNQLCYTCHAEKRGPFVWGHPPVEEKCTTCHTPHGAVHEKLLVQKAPNLCQECHDFQRHPGTRYSRETLFTGSAPSNRSFGRSCLNCHSNVHGSNAPTNPANHQNCGKFLNR
jgi:DmsE family decaheme c-type cytochrome